jgi:hypothetical protein
VTKQYINQLQKKVISILRKESSTKPLNILCADSCSEISRLISCWIINDFPDATVNILKGDNVQNTYRSHDIVLVEYQNSKILIDPSIWQFFADSDDICIGTVKNLNEALLLATKKYGGKWYISEKMSKCNTDVMTKLEDIILLNARQS